MEEQIEQLKNIQKQEMSVVNVTTDISGAVELELVSDDVFNLTNAENLFLTDCKIEIRKN